METSFRIRSRSFLDWNSYVSDVAFGFLFDVVVIDVVVAVAVVIDVEAEAEAAFGKRRTLSKYLECERGLT